MTPAVLSGLDQMRRYIGGCDEPTENDSEDQKKNWNNVKAACDWIVKVTGAEDWEGN